MGVFCDKKAYVLDFVMAALQSFTV